MKAWVLPGPHHPGVTLLAPLTGTKDGIMGHFMIMPIMQMRPKTFEIIRVFVELCIVLAMNHIIEYLYLFSRYAQNSKFPYFYS